MPPLARLEFLFQVRKPELARIGAASVIRWESGHEAWVRNAEDRQDGKQETKTAGHHLPRLNALRAFEATARHLSVKNAADELCVTPGAVSQLLKSLELHLGVTLFRRVNRGIFLTDAGQHYLPPVRNAFRPIADATGRHPAP